MPELFQCKEQQHRRIFVSLLHLALLIRNIFRFVDHSFDIWFDQYENDQTMIWPLIEIMISTLCLTSLAQIIDRIYRTVSEPFFCLEQGWLFEAEVRRPTFRWIYTPAFLETISHFIGAKQIFLVQEHWNWKLEVKKRGRELNVKR